MPLPIVPFSAVSKGSIGKSVRCEHCGENYVYIASRRAAGMGRSFMLLDNAGAKARAKRDADEQLAWDLSQAIEPAPCPCCGQLQKDMVRVARRRFHRWLTFIGATVLFCGLLYLPIYFLGQSGGQYAAGKNWSLMPAWIAITLGIAVLLVRWWMLRSYDPNSLKEHEKWLTKLNGAICTREQWDEVIESAGPVTTHAHESERRKPSVKGRAADALSDLMAATDEVEE